MRTSVTAFLAGILVVAMVVPAGADGSQAPEAAEGNSGWIVTLVDGVCPGQLAPGLARRVGGDVGFVFDKVLGGFSFSGSPQAAAALQRNPLVAAVVPDGLFKLQEVPTGVSRISGDDLHAFGGGSYRGSGVRVAVIDSGIDLDHPDLVANVDAAAGYNCVNPGASADDDNSHGTHVAGIIGASLNGTGVVGVAPEATLVAVKSFDAGGSASTAQVLCGINHVAGLAADGVPTVVNMSFVEEGTDSACDDGDATDAVHEAICDLVDLGVIPVAAAGNSSSSSEQLVPAVFDEVITVSALTDLDGEPGGLGGCLLLFIFCDDEFAYFSNFGPSVDVIAPGDPILSTVPGGGYGEKSGTSMAAPHVAGVVAAMLSADPSLTPSAAAAILQISGECPSGEINTGGPTCEGEIWPGDPDGVGEPLVNAQRAVQVTLTLGGGGGNIPPIASFIRNCIDLTCNFTDTTWEPDGSIVSWQWDFGDGATSSDQNPTHTFAAEGTYDVVLTVTDDDGDSGSAAQELAVPLPYSPEAQGDWVGVYGADGYWLGGWNGPSDLLDSDWMTVAVDQGTRYTWASSTTDVRALEAPDESSRKAATLYDASYTQVTLGFEAAYAGDLHVYSVDWDRGGRRQTVTVDDGNGPQVVTVDGAFDEGAWMHFTVDVAAGGAVTINATNDGPDNVVLSGVFLGNVVPTPPPPPPPPGLGDWVGEFGADGYWLGGWNGSSDLFASDTMTASVQQGSRYTWVSSTTETRALESPDESFRRVSALYSSSEVRMSLGFADAFVGDLHLFGVDWDSSDRRQTVTIDDGRGPQTVAFDESFSQGAWAHFEIDVAAGGSVAVVVANTGPTNAVLSGVFLGNVVPTPPPPPPPPGLGDWVGEFGADGYWLGGWNGSSDLLVSDWMTASVQQGSRYTWVSSTTETRALESPDESFRRVSALYSSSEVRMSLGFADAFVGDLHLFGVDWDSSDRRQTVTIDDGRGPQTVAFDESFSQGAWAHFEIDVAAGGSVAVVVANTGPTNAVLSGVFLGNVVPTPPPPPPPPGLGDWVGEFGADGYWLGGWNGSSDLLVSDWMTASVQQGSRYTWVSSTTETRALESPDESFRRVSALYSSSEVRMSLGFADAFVGDLHLFGVDWDSSDRRQTVTIDDGRGPQTVAFDESFSQGAWAHFEIDVAAGGSVAVVVANTGPTNAVLSGVFLGNVVPTPPPPPPPPGLGDWVGEFGADGYALAAWNRRSDLVSPDFPALTLDRGRRHRWSSSTAETRALEAPDESERRAATFYQKTRLEIQLTFDSAYSGSLHLYALDWDGESRRQTVTVDDGNGPQTVDLTDSFNDGVWMHFPIVVGAGDTVQITAIKTAGGNAVIGGIFLGE